MEKTTGPPLQKHCAPPPWVSNPDREEQATLCDLSLWSKAMVLKPEHAAELSGGSVKAQISGPSRRF